MVAKFVSVLLAVVFLQLSTRRVAAAVIRFSRLETGYTFTQYTRDFGRAYAPGSEEYGRRLALFQAELLEVQRINTRNAREGHLWKAGVHPFMDWTQEERRRLNGYKPSSVKARRASQALSLLHNGARAFGRSNATRGGQDSDIFDDLEDVATQGGLGIESGPQMRDQGDCGSCWAISAVEAVEAQLQRSGAENLKVSAQALLDCVPNPQHCGGSGGCDGATGELAYSFMRDHGIPLEGERPYMAQTRQCSQQPLSGAFPAATRVRVSGWNALPSNKAKPLMQALVSHGPSVVAVDGNNWYNYESGIFDGCEKDATISHAVLAKGYGEVGGTGYWLIQNSWGRQWGEQGHIRLMRHADEDSWCGTDRSPKEGVGCDGGPSEVTVCGSCGVLYDSLIPEGVRLESR
jgi:cathepsin L